jgi:hypothetical protein
MEHNALDVLCVGGGLYDDDIQNNICQTLVTVSLSDFEILEILSPRGIIAKSDLLAPKVLIRNNGSNANTLSVTFTVGSYIDIQNLYLEPGSSAELCFNDWLTPGDAGVCSTSCFLTVSDDLPCNDIINGEVLVLYEVGLDEDSFDQNETGIYTPRPNPFVYSMPITFELSQSGRARLDVYDVAGRLIEILQDGFLEAGEHSVVFDGGGLSDGVYLIRLTTETSTCTERCVLIR